MMEGPDSGLAMSILVAMLCVVVVPALIGGAIGYGVRGERSAGLAVLLGAVIGGLLGITAVAAFVFLGIPMGM